METIELELRVSGSPEQIFEVSRDHLPELISEFTVVAHLRRDHTGSRDSTWTTTDRWEIDVLKPLPSFLTRFVGFQIITVRSRIHWQKRDLETTWSISVPEMEGLLQECQGTVTFQEDGENTLLVLEGRFDLDLSAVPGFPGFLANYLRGRQTSLIKRIIRQYLPKFKQKIESVE